MNLEGIRYAGSKAKLLPQIVNAVNDLEVITVIDAFSGSGRVSQALKQAGYIVTANDLSIWSKVINTTFLLANKPHSYYQGMIDHLNNLEGIYGWFSETYGGLSRSKESLGLDGKKKPWQLHNTQKLDAIRLEIDKITSNEIDKFVLLTSLILALDKVDNTLGHHVSYIRTWSKRSYAKLKLTVPQYIIDDKPHKVYQTDALDLLHSSNADLIYIDPPYGSNNDDTPTSRVRYASYYHLWKTVILNDQPEVFGEANRRIDSLDALNYNMFEDYKQSNNRYNAEIALDTVLNAAVCKYIILSYSNNGRIPYKCLLSLVEDRLLKELSINHKNHGMTNMLKNSKYTNTQRLDNAELLFILKG